MQGVMLPIRRLLYKEMRGTAGAAHIQLTSLVAPSPITRFTTPAMSQCLKIMTELAAQTGELLRIPSVCRGQLHGEAMKPQGFAAMALWCLMLMREGQYIPQSTYPA